jgi:antitoxin VapB
MANTTKVFKNGGSKAIRLPPDSCEVGDEMLVRRVGYAIMLVPKSKAWKMFRDAIVSADPNAPIERQPQGRQSKRKSL